ncbi:hypothetical protein E4U45_005224 [Claviceps purpurea]|nr:hypothetical protein E4U45_005224 [Claviceps purpurea]
MSGDEETEGGKGGDYLGLPSVGLSGLGLSTLGLSTLGPRTLDSRTLDSRTLESRGCRSPWSQVEGNGTSRPLQCHMPPADSGQTTPYLFTVDSGLGLRDSGFRRV